MRTVRSIGDLGALPRDPLVNGFAGRPKLRVDIPDLPLSLRLELERRLNRYQDMCGCATGAAVFLVTLIAGGVSIFAKKQALLSFAFLGDAVGVFGLAFLLGFIGKFASMAATRMQFAAACGRMTKELAAFGPEPGVEERDVDVHTLGRQVRNRMQAVG